MRSGGTPRPPGPPAPVTRRRSVAGMTLEMAGTLMGAAVHGLIVAGAHGPHRCGDAALAGPLAVSPDAVSAPAARPLGRRSPSPSRSSSRPPPPNPASSVPPTPLLRPGAFSAGSNRSQSSRRGEGRGRATGRGRGRGEGPASLRRAG